MEVLIVSSNFSPGHIGHLKAWYKLCRDCGYNAKLYLEERYTTYFKNNEYDYIVTMEEVEKFNPNIAIIYNIGFKNISFINWSQKNQCKVIYVLHEPYMGIRELLKEGSYAIKQFVASLLNFWICYKVQRIIVCSRYAQKNLGKYMKICPEKVIVFPLIFLDEYKQDKIVERTYFSMIGGYSKAHGSDMFIKYIKESYQSGSRQKYQIATRSNISAMMSDPIYEEMQKKGLLIVQQGRPLTEEEMNAAYRRSIATWNGYRRSTQSGVLPNSFMHGTPVVATKVGSFKEFIKPKATGVFIDNFRLETITNAINQIRQEGDAINHSCRKYFLEHFYYGGQKERFKNIIETIGAE